MSDKAGRAVGWMLGGTVLVLLPVAVRAGDRAALGKLVRHIVG